MLALVMAGGTGSRLGLGEKPLVTISGIPMVEYICLAFRDRDYEPVLVASPSTPYTINWARARGIHCIRASGTGYISDLHEAVEILEEKGPFFTCVADLPCLTSSHVDMIQNSYNRSGREALSVWVPFPAGRNSGGEGYPECIDGIQARPAGINILRGDLIDRSQDELKLLVRDPALRFNINTREDLERVREFILHKKI